MNQKIKTRMGQLLFLLSGISFFCFLFPSNARSFVPFAGIVLFLLWFLLKKKNSRKKEHSNGKEEVLAFVLSFALIPVYQYASGGWKVSDRIVFGMIFFAGTIVFLFSVLYQCRQSEKILWPPASSCGERESTFSFQSAGSFFRRKKVWIALLFGSVVITVFSNCSPLYALNTSSDNNCYLTVGKAISHGLVLYRDIIEQKGPIMYFIYAVSYQISHTSFIGIYFLEIICFLVTFSFLYKTVRLFTDHENVFWILLFFMGIAYSMDSVSYGGSVEELCLPFFSYAIYISTAALKRRQSVSKKTYFLIGITSGVVLWMKFSVLGIYPGWFFLPTWILIKRKQWLEIIKNSLCILSGVLTGSLPVFAYFGFHHAFKELMEVYFYDNIFYYSDIETNNAILDSFSNLMDGLYRLYDDAFWMFFLIFLGVLFFLIRKEYQILLHFLLMFFLQFFLIFIGGRNYAYYPFVFTAYLSFGTCFLSGIFGFILKEAEERTEKKGKENQKMSCGIHRKNRVSRGICCFVISGILLCAFSMFLIKYEKNLWYHKEELPQIQFARMISKKENPSLLNYMFMDGGFYTTTDIVPTCRFFCTLNCHYPTQFEEQKEVIEKGLVDFVVTRDRTLESGFYDLIAKSSYWENDFYLYQKTK